jgi:elongation factor G
MPDTARPPRSIALVGPYGSGKSTLFEALLQTAGAPVRRMAGRNRTASTEIRVGHCSFLGDPWSIVDCPGSIEFAYETAGALTAVDLAVVVCDAAPERALTLSPLFKLLEDENIPHIVFVNKIDSHAGHVRDTLAALQPHSRRPLVLRQVPIREGETVTGYVDVVSERAYRYRKGQESELISLPSALADREREAFDGLVEVLADHDDALLEKLLEEIRPTAQEVYAQLHKDQATGAIVEVLLGSAERDNGVRRLWKALRHDVPLPAETAGRRGIETAGEPLAHIFKTVYAPHSGKLSYARVWRGPIKDGATIAGQRIAGISKFTGGEPAKVGEAVAGEIVAMGRLEGLATGATLGPADAAIPYPEPPQPVYAFALSLPDRKDEVKLSGALQKLVEEDPSLSVLHDQDTGETVLAGQGEIHLNAAIERLAATHNLKVKTIRPQVAFKETIRKAVHEHSRFKRQTGGHGQFADIKIDIAPRARGEGFLFVDKIVGGAVPRQFIPAVGEAAEEATRKGAFGFPVVDISVTLVDGTFHTVDSSDMAFKTATRQGMAEGLAKADPVLLEPIDHVAVSVPNDYTASAQRLLTGRRGQILGFAAKPGWNGWDEVEALVPEAELHDLIIELRSLTMGLGTYRRRFAHLAEAPSRLVEKIAQEAAAMH